MLKKSVKMTMLLGNTENTLTAMATPTAQQTAGLQDPAEGFRSTNEHQLGRPIQRERERESEIVCVYVFA